MHKIMNRKVADLLRLPILKKQNMTMDDVISAVYWNDKHRYRLARTEGEMIIGANQGHSFEVNPDEVHRRVDESRPP